jgi:hypothetical protein
VLDHEGGKSILVHDSKIAVFNSDGDAIVSHSTRSIGTAVKDACEAINKDWPSRASKVSAQKQAPQLVTVSATSAIPEPSKIAVSSTPVNADIMVDGSFVGNTPSNIEVALGDHVLSISKSGFQSWERKFKATGGSTVNINAELQAQSR